MVYIDIIRIIRLSSYWIILFGVLKKKIVFAAPRGDDNPGESIWNHFDRSQTFALLGAAIKCKAWASSRCFNEFSSERLASECSAITNHLFHRLLMAKCKAEYALFIYEWICECNVNHILPRTLRSIKESSTVYVSFVMFVRTICYFLWRT